MQRAESLEWDESSGLAVTADGIGSLSLNHRGTGYMGPQSGNALLRTLQASSMLLRTTNTQPSQLSPEPEFSEHIIQSPAFCNQCLDYYFKYYNTAYPILHEAYFRAQYSGYEAPPFSP